MSTTWRCPRCGELSDTPPGASRAVPERDIDVCGPCCTDEAYHDANGRPLPKVASWPVMRLYNDVGGIDNEEPR